MRVLTIVLVGVVATLWLVWLKRGCGTDGSPPSGWARIKRSDGTSVLMGQNETTVREYMEFVRWIAETGDHRGCDKREGPGRTHRPKGVRAEFLRRPDGPISGIDWFDALAFSRWRGARLPTTAEWTLARLDPGNTQDAGSSSPQDTDWMAILFGLSVEMLRGEPEKNSGARCVSMNNGVSEWCMELSCRDECVPLLGGNWYFNVQTRTRMEMRDRTYRHSTVGLRLARDEVQAQTVLHAQSEVDKK